MGCREPNDVYNNLTSEENEWLALKEGSYWVMQEKSSGILDTITVIKHDANMNQTEVENHFEESVTIEFNSTLTNEHFYIIFSATSRGIRFRRYLNTINESYLVVFPINQGDSINSSDNFDQFVHFDSVYTTYTIGALSFSNVVRSFDNLNPAYNFTPTKFYFAKGKGIIKMEFLSTNKVYETIEYRIVQ